MAAASARYRLNGHLLTLSSPEDIVIDHAGQRGFDTDITDFKDSVSVDDLGYGTGRFTIALILRGTDQAREARFISEELQTSPWTLEVQDGAFTGETALFEDHQRLAFALDNFNQEPSQTYKHLVVKIRAHLLGAWRADGGTVCKQASGFFEQTSSGVYDNEDGQSVTNFEITLPEQLAGFPKARNASTDVLEQLTPSSTSTEQTRDGETRTLETYDLSGYLWPSDPSSDGDVGQWTVESCPSLAYLQANTNPLPVRGVASQRVAGFRVASG